MPSRPPPPTPWVSSRFTDESLLLDAEPIFDVSLGESEWGGEKTVRLDGDLLEDDVRSRNEQDKRSPDMTLDLEDYLPEDSETTTEGPEAKGPQKEEADGQGLNVVDERRYERGQSEGSNWAASSSTSASNPTSQYTSTSSVSPTHLTHKRMGSETEQAAPPKKHRHCHRPPVNNDFFSRRLSDSNRGSSIAHLSSMLPPPPPISQQRTPLADTISSSGSEPTPLTLSLSSHMSHPPVDNASRRLKASIMAEARPRNEGDPQSTDPRSTMKSIPPYSTGSSSGSKSSALSRYLAKSSVLTAAAKEVEEEKLESAPTRSSYESGAQAHHVPVSPRPLPSNSTAPLGALLSPLVLVAESELSNRAQSVDMPRASRRMSVGEKVVNFLSSLIKPPTPAGSSEKEGEKERSGEVWAVEAVDAEAEGRREDGRSVKESDMEGVRMAKNGTTRPLTKPIPFSRPLHLPKGSTDATRVRGSMNPHSSNSASRAPLQPTRTQSNTLTLTKPIAPSFSTGDKPRTKPYSRPTTTSAFATAALARLPPPGKGSSAAAQPVKVKDGERARDLLARRDMFERLASSSSSSSSRPGPAPKPHSAGLRRTVPLRGHTPGKSSALRAQQRAQFDEAVRAKNREKEEMEKEERRKREEEEERAYRESRKETVIWAKPVPEMYRGGKR